MCSTHARDTESARNQGVHVLTQSKIAANANISLEKVLTIIVVLRVLLNKYEQFVKQMYDQILENLLFLNEVVVFP